MSIFVYADESGVFDKKNHQCFIFGGVLYLDKEERDSARRKYKQAEKALRSDNSTVTGELKASKISNKAKSKLFRSLNQTYKFAVVIDLSEIYDTIFAHKKTKQRYLDFAFKLGLKKLLQDLLEQNIIDISYSESLHVFMDDHTTATDGCYELRESLEQEFKIGLHTNDYHTWIPPILPNLQTVTFAMKNSQTEALIRAADIVSNRTFHYSRTEQVEELKKKICVTELPPQEFT